MPRVYFERLSVKSTFSIQVGFLQTHILERQQIEDSTCPMVMASERGSPYWHFSFQGFRWGPNCQGFLVAERRGWENAVSASLWHDLISRGTPFRGSPTKCQLGSLLGNWAVPRAPILFLNLKLGRASSHEFFPGTLSNLCRKLSETAKLVFFFFFLRKNYG